MKCLRFSYWMLLILLPFQMVFAQATREDIGLLSQKIERQNKEIQELRSKLELETSDFRKDNNEIKKEFGDYASVCLVLFLFGAVCALWAQNTGHNPWVWFVLGMAFSVFTIVTVIAANDKFNKTQ